MATCPDTPLKSFTLAKGLTEFPDEIFEHSASLEILDLSNNRLNVLPDKLEELQELKIAFFTNNCFEEIPTVLARCPKLSMISFKSNRLSVIKEGTLSPALTWLILTNNQISQLPASLGNLPQLKKLAVAHNRIQHLPPEMANCRNLELIRIAANNLKELPDWLIALPKLAWLGFAGNPCSQRRSPFYRALSEFSWNNIELIEKLGAGASGTTHKGKINLPDGSAGQCVAVKVFGDNISADGVPADEIEICSTLGSHNNIISTLGKLADPQSGLIFGLAPESYSVLADPPDFNSCTRDIYPSDTTFSIQQILRTISELSSALEYMHKRGVLHGDLYAHNILVDRSGESLITDFGAATLFDRTDVKISNGLERLEVRAFGYLIEELIERCSEKTHQAYAVLANIVTQCLSLATQTRPSFSQIHSQLRQIYYATGS